MTFLLGAAAQRLLADINHLAYSIFCHGGGFPSRREIAVP